MDPNANLKEAREIFSRIIYQWENDKEISPQDTIRLAELNLAMDEWLSRGGFLPFDWKP